MKTILYMTASIDGKTTQGKENVDWVTEADIERMDALMKECGVMLMGKKTYESFGEELPSDQALMIVMTSDQNLLSKNLENILFVSGSPKNVLKIIEQKGFKSALLAGGNKLNASFLKEDLIDEIRLIIEPIVLGTGKSLFDHSEEIKKFELIDIQKLEGGVLEVRYTKI